MWGWHEDTNQRMRQLKMNGIHMHYMQSIVEYCRASLTNHSIFFVLTTIAILGFCAIGFLAIHHATLMYGQQGKRITEYLLRAFSLLVVIIIILLLIHFVYVEYWMMAIRYDSRTFKGDSPAIVVISISVASIPPLLVVFASTALAVWIIWVNCIPVMVNHAIRSRREKIGQDSK
jgi:hypothetical protein